DRVASIADFERRGMLRSYLEPIATLGERSLGRERSRRRRNRPRPDGRVGVRMRRIQRAPDETSSRGLEATGALGRRKPGYEGLGELCDLEVGWSRRTADDSDRV